MAVIGDPVAHTLSPRIHNAAFAALGLDAVYVALPVRAADLPAAVHGLAALGMRGASVTVPHKEAAATHLDEVHDDARALGAVNTIVVQEGRLHGHNTDVEGVRRPLVEQWPDRRRGARALLLGAGGAARSAAAAMARLGLEVTVVNRTAGRAERLVEVVRGAVPGADLRAAPWTALDGSLVAQADLIVNATTLGMDGTDKVPSVLADNVEARQVVFDLVYGRGPTDLLTRARARGATVIDGTSMLVFQAAAAFERWTGRPAPVDVMRDAADQR